MQYKHLFYLLIYISSVCSAHAIALTGQQIATQGNGKGATSCASCHGANGEGMSAAGFPKLAGLNADYLQRQIKLFQDGSRQSPVMAPVAKALSPAETNAVTKYYARLKTPSRPVTLPADTLGKKLATLGSWPDRHLPTCEQCHGPGGTGIGAAFPALAGQQASYIKLQLNAWQQGTRRGDPLGMMKHVADRLSTKEIDAVANYFAALPPQPGSKNPEQKQPIASTPADKSATGPVTQQTESSPAHSQTDQGMFTPPAHGNYPAGPLGEAVRRGEAIFNQTNSHPDAGRYVGNNQQCANCHLDAGRLSNSAPMWAAWVAYPAYRKKNNKVNDMTMRIQGCFTYSMNAPGSETGHAPAADARTITDLLSYLYWISQGAPTGDTHMAGRGYPKLEETDKGFDPVRGKKVYRTHCAVCHGIDGQGVIRNGTTLFPPLWGPKSYNWGAGMHKVNTAAGFIKANMPLGMPDSLSSQDAWDVAAYINSHQRPQDPRYKGNVQTTKETYHKSKYDYYGKRKGSDGKLLGDMNH